MLSPASWAGLSGGQGGNISCGEFLILCSYCCTIQSANASSLASCQRTPNHRTINWIMLSSLLDFFVRQMSKTEEGESLTWRSGPLWTEIRCDLSFCLQLWLITPLNYSSFLCFFGSFVSFLTADVCPSAASIFTFPLKLNRKRKWSSDNFDTKWQLNWIKHYHPNTLKDWR